MSKHSEPQREREVQRLYQGWLSAQGSSLNVALNVDSIAAPDLHGNGYKPQASQDRALTAFAQLAVLKLGVRRAMVSLIDRDTQMILAESTSTLRFGQAPDNDLWLGSTILSRPDAVCEHALRNTYTARDPEDEKAIYTAPGLVVPDCRLDTRFDTRPYVVCEPGVRFYAGVPISSPSGHRIGVYAVSDERPRFGLTIEELHFMQGVAQAVMDHLEWARDRVDRFKGERIVRGLASFIEGSSAADPSGQDTELSRTPSASRPPQISLASRRRPLSRNSSYSRHSNNADGTSNEHPQTPGVSSATSSMPPKDKNPPKQGNQAQPKSDGLSRMFTRAAELLRQSTLADGVVLFGASASNNKQLSRGTTTSGGLPSSDDDELSVPVTSGSEGVGLDSSDSDTSPSGRPCKILAYALADEQARADIEQGSALTLGTLEKYFSLYPKGKTFSFTTEGAGISSEDDSASDREPGKTTTDSDHATNGSRRRRAARMDHKELLKKIPGAKSVVFVPLYDHSEDRLAGGCFLWTSVMGRMMNLDEDLSYLRAFGNSIMSEVGRINTQKNEAAKTTFIASMSHELRSPLHGILGAAEFLMDTATDSYQSGLITSISTCGKTLLDTLNHVLDYSKINKLGRAQMRRNARQNKLINLASDSSLESLNMTAVVDLAILVEEVVDAVTAGHTFKKLPGLVLSQTSKSNVSASVNTMSGGNHAAATPEGAVSVLLDICPRASWMVRTQPGALRRIIMNLLGNALKYTSSGFVQVSLRATEHSNGGKTSAMVQVVDSGKGMSEEFQRDRLFVPFSQEDSFQPGTGLGLSIVKQIVDSLGGSIEVKSEQYKGTEVTVHLNLLSVPDDSPHQPDEEMHTIAERTKGQNLVILDCESPAQPPHLTQQIQRLNETLVTTCSLWFEMEASRQDVAPDDADLYLYCEPPSVEALQQRFRQTGAHRKNREIPIIIICLNAEEAIKISQNQGRALTDLGRIVEVIPQPCGPRKLAKVFSHCLQRKEEMANDADDSGDESPDLTEAHKALEQTPSTQPPLQPIPEVRLERKDSVIQDNTPPQKPVDTEPAVDGLPHPSPPPLNPATPSLQEQEGARRPGKTAGSQNHVLLVDDNKINLQLLVMFMKKCGYSYEEAENGQEALDKFKEAYLPGPHCTGADLGRQFDFVLMDISMPVMNGLEATRHIRDFERENELDRTNIIALTGLASADAQRDAKAAGVDVFLPKPVRFAELKKLLTAKV